MMMSAESASESLQLKWIHRFSRLKKDIWSSRIPDFFPAWEWVPRYRFSSFFWDIIAGLTYGAMAVPQSMAYAHLANLPSSVGLYTSLFPAMAYVLLGSSPCLACGPSAVSSMTTAHILSMSGLEAGSRDYLIGASFLALLTGLLSMGLGFLRLGRAIRFISEPVVGGFTTAAALLIILSQVHDISGIERTGSSTDPAWLQVYDLWDRCATFHGWTFLVGFVSLLFLLLPRLFKHGSFFPAPLLLLVSATALSHFCHFSRFGIEVIGEIRTSLPAPWLPVGARLLREHGAVFALGGVVQVVLALAEGTSIARKFTPLGLNYSAEMAALGLANVVSGLARGYPCTGSFSRTAVAAAAGASSPMHNVFSALVVLCAVFLGGLLYALPKAVLAAVVIPAALPLLDFRSPVRYALVDLKDLALYLATFLGVLAVGVVYGLLAALLLAMLVALWRIGGMPVLERRFQDPARDTTVHSIAMPSAISFANALAVLDALLEARDADLVEVDFTAVEDIDSSGVDILEEGMQACQGPVVFVGLHAAPVARTMLYAGGRVAAAAREAIRSSKLSVEASSLQSSSINFHAQSPLLGDSDSSIHVY